MGEQKLTLITENANLTVNEYIGMHHKYTLRLKQLLWKNNIKLPWIT